MAFTEFSELNESWQNLVTDTLPDSNTKNISITTSGQISIATHHT